MNDHPHYLLRALQASSVSRRRFMRDSAIAAALPSLMAAALSGPARAQDKKLGTLVVAIQEGDTRTLDPQGATAAADAATKDTARAWLDQHSAGSGPFVLEAWEHGSQLTVKRNPLYWGKQPPFDRVVFKFVKDPNIQRSLLVRGDAHIAANLAPDLAADLKDKPGIGIL